jgi:hypothetical protein
VPLFWLANAPPGGTVAGCTEYAMPSASGIPENTTAGGATPLTSAAFDIA